MGLGPTNPNRKLDEIIAGLTVVDGFHDVPAADSAVNDQMRDVIGNKEDAAGQTADVTSLMGVLRQTLEDALLHDEHFHNRERWLGLMDPQTDTDWALDTLSPYTAVSGNNDYGTDADDEALVLGTDDTPVIAGMVMFDLHRIFIVEVSTDTPWKLRIIHGSGTMNEAIAAGQYTEVVVMSDLSNPQQSSGTPLEVVMLKVRCGIDQVWVQAWNATDNATIDFLVGLHEYLE